MFDMILLFLYYKYTELILDISSNQHFNAIL